MPKIAYIEKRFSVSSLELIDTCNDIIATYQAQGYRLTLRQLYYQLVSRNIVENTERSYKRIGSIVNDARLAGKIDWLAIEDRGRSLHSLSHWETPADIIRSARHSFRLDKWKNQMYRPEVWVEKAALEGVIAGVCNQLDVPYFACRGYNSQSEEWEAARRIQGYRDGGQTPIIFYLGDHDPSGIDMTRDHIDRLTLFMGGVHVERLALNMEQISRYNPPPNPAKDMDSRFTKYVELYGDESWELDALEPQVIADLIRDAIVDHRNDERYNEIVEEEQEQIELLKDAEDRWGEIANFLRELVDPEEIR